LTFKFLDMWISITIDWANNCLDKPPENYAVKFSSIIANV
jgi:hypothetical protein